LILGMISLEPSISLTTGMNKVVLNISPERSTFIYEEALS
jgi:hypothetical protein